MLNFACKEFKLMDIIQCSLGLSKAECRLFDFLLYEEEPLTTFEIASRLEVDRTTVQKSIKSLVDKDVVLRLQENLDKGGYIFRYQIKNKDALRAKIKSIVSRWSQQVQSELDNW